MKTNIKATDLTLTEAITNYLNEKLRDLERFLPVGDESAMAEVELARLTRHHRQGEVFKAEINLRAGGQARYSVAEAADLYAAIDEMKDEIIRQVKSGSAKRVTLFRRGARRAKAMLRSLPWWRR